MLKCGIVGLPNVGKSTLFNALTETQSAVSANYPFCTIEPNVGIVELQDSRLDKLASIAGSKKTIYSCMQFVDIAGLIKGASKGEGLGNQFLSHIREVDAIIHLLRCFEDENIIHVDGEINPLRDKETIDMELIFADMQSIEKRILGLEKRARIGTDKEAAEDIRILKDILVILNEGKPAREKYNEIKNPEIKKYNLITTKPVVYCCNVNESDLIEGNIYTKKVEEIAKSEGTESVIISASIESEISTITDKEERREFLISIGLNESGLNKIVKASYKILDLYNYFTIGEKEARSWTFTNGTTAPKAAGIIHSDFERGFIRAEIISYEDYIACGSENKAKEMGKLRSEGRGYVMKDADIVHFRFNV